MITAEQVGMLGSIIFTEIVPAFLGLYLVYIILKKKLNPEKWSGIKHNKMQCKTKQ